MLTHLTRLKPMRRVYLSTRPPQKSVGSRPFKKILVANRGEIACRILKTARRLGIHSVAVYSDADKGSLHTLMADEAHYIGKAASSESYLRGSTILDIAKRTKCQGIHPGYGFLSENYEFSESCKKAGIVFIGPPASAIRDMGIKSISKSIMSKAGVPVIGGYHGDDQSVERLVAEANNIGYPIMIKANRGGGGKGMRIAYNAEEFEDALQSAKTESEKAFGDSSVLLERYITSPRHIEVQIFGDQHGNTVHLFERDCSVQRRHQKIIEEAPAPGLTEEQREAFGEAAVKAAKAVNYVGAGTVEFIVDKEDQSFHFMEMNTRLQVEHAITEMITRTDLVEWQFRVASGEVLPLTQEQITRKGHAFEARIYAENPLNDFLPAAGKLRHLSIPRSSKYVRVETGVRQGDIVSVHYDPMIAKLIVWNEDRPKALKMLRKKLGEYHIGGVDTNVNFLIALASHPKFQSGDIHTGFIQENAEELFPPITITDDLAIRAAVTLFLNEDNTLKKSSSRRALLRGDPFLDALRYRVNHDFIREYYFELQKQPFKVDLKSNIDDMKIRISGSKWNNVKVLLVHYDKEYTIQLDTEGQISAYSATIYKGYMDLFTPQGKLTLKVKQPKFLDSSAINTESKLHQIASPMPGVLEKLLVDVGDEVKKGDQVAVIIAMKMQHVLKAPRDGVVKSIGATEGDNVSKGKAFIHFEDEAPKQQ